MTLADRAAQLKRYHAHYLEREAEPYLVRNDGRDQRNPWTGLRRAAERALERLGIEAETPPRQNGSSAQHRQEALPL